jgi:hypothetical protein
MTNERLEEVKARVRAFNIFAANVQHYKTQEFLDLELALSEIERLRAALHGVMDCTGTGTRQYHIAREALQQFEPGGGNT